MIFCTCVFALCLFLIISSSFVASTAFSMVSWLFSYRTAAGFHVETLGSDLPVATETQPQCTKSAAALLVAVEWIPGATTSWPVRGLNMGCSTLGSRVAPSSGVRWGCGCIYWYKHVVMMHFSTCIRRNSPPSDRYHYIVLSTFTTTIYHRNDANDAILRRVISA